MRIVSAVSGVCVASCSRASHVRLRAVSIVGSSSLVWFPRVVHTHRDGIETGIGSIPVHHQRHPWRIVRTVVRDGACQYGVQTREPGEVLEILFSLDFPLEFMLLEGRQEILNDSQWHHFKTRYRLKLRIVSGGDSAAAQRWVIALIGKGYTATFWICGKGLWYCGLWRTSGMKLQPVNRNIKTADEAVRRTGNRCVAMQRRGRRPLSKECTTAECC